MPDWLESLYNDIRGVWEKLPTSRKWLLGGVCTALLVGLVAFTIALYAFPDPEFFVGNVPPNERGKIIGYLREQGVGYEVDEAGDIYVHGDAANLYWEFASQQPEGELGGYSWLLGTNWGMTRDQFSETSLRSHQQVLARAIVDGNPKILTARVFLAEAKEGLFPSTSEGSTASVSVTTRGGAIDRRTVEGIQMLVAGSMAGLDPQNVQVLGDGKPLAGFREQSETEKLTTEQQQAQSDAEEKRRKAIANSLDPVVGGPANYTSTVIVEVNYDQVEINEVITDPESPFEKSITREEINDTTVPTGDTPGTPPNLPGDTLGQGAQSGQRSELSQETSTIENIPRKVVESRKKIAPGKLIKQSIAVTVNHKLDPNSGVLVPRTADEMSSLEETLKAAVGHIEDSTAYRFALTQTAFDTSAEQKMVAQAKQESFRRNLESGAFLVAGLILIGVFFYFLKKVFSIAPEEKEVFVEEALEPPAREFSLVELGLRELGDEDGLSPDAQKSKVIREQIESYAAEHPELVAGILKSWISE